MMSEPMRRPTRDSARPGWPANGLATPLPPDGGVVERWWGGERGVEDAEDGVLEFDERADRGQASNPVCIRDNLALPGLRPAWKIVRVPGRPEVDMV